MDPLERFTLAQDGIYPTALAEIKSGRKRSHWMWFIFPQLRGLGRSPMAYEYSIANLEEAKAYLAHPCLSARLTEITEALLLWVGTDPEEIFGHTDAMKLRSSLTLFALVSTEGSVFHKALESFFDGKADELTLKLASGMLSQE